MTFHEYAAIPAVNWSTLGEIRRSPRHYKHRLANPIEDTARLGAGRALHTAVLEPDRFPLDYVVFEGPRRAGKEWTGFEEANKGRTILKLGEYENVLAMRDAVRRHPVARKHLEGIQAEQTITWTERVGGIEIPCKARPDAIGRSIIIDLKSTKDAGPREFGRTVARYGYHCQLSWYRRGVRAALGRDLDMVLLAVEFTEPHDVCVYRITKDDALAADEQVGELLSLLATCRANDRWPGVSEEELGLVLPPWAFPPDETDEGTAFDDVEVTTGDGL